MAQLYFRYSTMGAGKSIEVQKVAFNYEERGQTCGRRTGIMKQGVAKEINIDDLYMNDGDWEDLYLESRKEESEAQQ